MVEELPEEVELLRREPDLLVADVHLALARVDREVAVLDLVGLALSPLGGGAAEDALDPGHELARVERLRHVVVRADLEPDDLVDVLVPRGEHEDRDIRGLADATTELDAVAVREVEVEDDETGRVGRELNQCRLRGCGGRHPIARVAEVCGDEGRDRGLILDHEDRGRSRHGLPPSRRRLRRRSLERESLGIDGQRQAAVRLRAAVGAVARVETDVVSGPARLAVEHDVAATDGRDRDPRCRARPSGSRRRRAGSAGPGRGRAPCAARAAPSVSFLPVTSGAKRSLGV